MAVTLTSRTFKFEVTDPDADVHELLCLAIHEDDQEALEELYVIVTNITEVTDA